jgi:hypothetical protein
MANHVYFTITPQMNEEATKALSDAMLTETHERKLWHSEEMQKVEELVDLDHLPFLQLGQEYDEDGHLKDSWNWYVDNIGAKWCHVEEWEDGYISGYSAWSAPVAFCEHLLRYLISFDKDASIQMTYEDEFRNFFGVMDFFNDGEGDVDSDYSEIEGDELADAVNSKFKLESGAEWEDEHTEYADELVYSFFDSNGRWNYDYD